MSLPDGERSQVILLGASKFADTEALPPVPEVLRNVSDLAAVFTDSAFGIVPAANCSHFVDDDRLPTLGRRLRAITSGAEDLLLVYYAGHGLKAGPRHELYLAMYETDPEDPDFGALKYETLRRIVVDSPATTKVIILDCCFSGAAFGGELAGPVESLLGQLEVKGCYVLTSAQADNVAVVLPGEEHTAFTGRLLSVLGEGVPSEVEFLTLDALYRAVHAQLTAVGLPTPLNRGSRTSQDLILARNRGFSGAVAEAGRRRFAQAEALAAQGQWSAALTILREAQAEQARVLGADHEDTWRTQHVLARNVAMLGAHAEAEALLTEIVECAPRASPTHAWAEADLADLTEARP